MAADGRFPSDRMSIVKLDEWLDVPLGDPHTCESFLRRHLLDPLGLPDERYIGFDSQPADAQSECRRVEAEITRAGGIDLAILGIGVNGHIGLKEPAEYAQLSCHVSDLAPTTIEHSMLQGVTHHVHRGITLGIRDIRNARRILLLAFGDRKAEAVGTLLSQQISSRFPASFLWLHPSVTCLCDQDAAPQGSEVP